MAPRRSTPATTTMLNCVPGRRRFRGGSETGTAAWRTCTSTTMPKCTRRTMRCSLPAYSASTDPPAARRIKARGGARAAAAIGFVLALCVGPAPLLAQRATDTAFAALVARLSEPGGYFDSDNIITNEASYLFVSSQLAKVGVHGGVYVGVGPDQNFSYVA